MMYVYLSDIRIPGRCPETYGSRQCCFNVGPPSTTLGQHQNNIELAYRACCLAMSLYIWLTITCDLSMTACYHVSLTKANIT